MQGNTCEDRSDLITRGFFKRMRDLRRATEKLIKKSRGCQSQNKAIMLRGKAKEENNTKPIHVR